MCLSTKAINGLLNTKWMTFLTSPNAPAAAATIATISNITKDGVNCYYYVSQSLNNERIPEDKRKFVASLDLSNGILNIVTQAIVGYVVPKMTNKLFENRIAPYFASPKSTEKLLEVAKKAKIKDVTLDGCAEALQKCKGAAKVGLSVVAALVGTQIIAKRIIVPLIATPMASFFKAKFENAEKNKQNQTDSVNISFKNNEQTPNCKGKNLPDCFKQFK